MNSTLEKMFENACEGDEHEAQAGVEIEGYEQVPMLREIEYSLDFAVAMLREVSEPVDQRAAVALCKLITEEARARRVAPVTKLEKYNHDPQAGAGAKTIADAIRSLLYGLKYSKD